MENTNRTKELVIAGTLLAMGIIITNIFHATGIPGTIFLPMHIPSVFRRTFITTIFSLGIGNDNAYN